MAASIRKSKIDQNELRKIMKGSKTTIKTKTTRIESPLAKYNHLDQLTCVVCNTQIKNESLWAAHIRGKVHKENLEKLKKPEKKGSIAKNQGTKRINQDSQNHEFSKKRKDEFVKPKSNEIPPGFFDKSTSQTASSPEEKMEADDHQDTNISKSSNLPQGFFDSRSKTEKAVEASTSNHNINSNSLPEGFFDDPVAEAKVRKVEYKDPMDEEWENFQKTMSTETSVSQAILEDELEENKVGREIDEIDEQMLNWNRVQKLQKMKEKIPTQAESYSMEMDDNMSSADEEEFEEFLDWRSKKVR